MARNNRKGKGAGPTLRTMKDKKNAMFLKYMNRKRNLLQKHDSTFR